MARGGGGDRVVVFGFRLVRFVELWEEAEARAGVLVRFWARWLAVSLAGSANRGRRGRGVTVRGKEGGADRR